MPNSIHNRGVNTRTINHGAEPSPAGWRAPPAARRGSARAGHEAQLWAAALGRFPCHSDDEIGFSASRQGHTARRGPQKICILMLAADTTQLCNISAKSYVVNSIRHF